MRKKSLLLCILITGLFLATVASATQVEFSSTLNPVGSGARATGMGGAFIGVADDATAASWNPAGLIQLEKPELSLVYSALQREQTYHTTLHPEMNGNDAINTDGINYASFAYPFIAFSRNMIVSLNYQQLYQMNKRVSFNYRWDLGGGDYTNDTIRFYQKGHLYALSPAFAVQIRPGLSVGATLNIWRNILGQNGWDNSYRSKGIGTAQGNSITETFILQNSFDIEGFNANMGALWNITDTVVVGCVFKTAFDAKLRHSQSVYRYQDIGGTISTAPPAETSDNMVMKMPASFGLGFQYRRSDKLTFAIDAYRTQWSRFLIRDAAGNEFNPQDSAMLSEGRLSDTMQFRFGAEYLIIGNSNTIALRAGLFSDPEPSKGKVDNYAGISLGTGYSTPKFAFDASYQYRWGVNVDGDIAAVQRESMDIKQQTVMVSGIYYF